MRVGRTKSRDHHLGHVALPPFVGPSQRLAVDRHHAFDRGHKIQRETPKRFLEPGRVEHPENPVKVSWLGIPCFKVKI